MGAVEESNAIKNVLVTGGAGFIGSALVRHLIGTGAVRVTNVDCLTYAGNPDAMTEVASSPRYQFAKVDICDEVALRRVVHDAMPDAIVHLAAESHVDRSIDGPAKFIQTNVIGTYHVLEVALEYWRKLPERRKTGFRLHHVSTDEVFGSCATGELFTEQTPYRPNSPYSATKAAADHLVRSWHRTYGLPVVISNCSNNYGPYQFPEKLIPLTILSAIRARPLPVYGDGGNIRDWLYVDDHCRALMLVLERGSIGETYNIGGRAPMENRVVVEKICALLDEMRARSDGHGYCEQITYVADRPGHDRHYAIDPARIEEELGWSPLESFDSGLRKTVQWYLDNEAWCRGIEEKRYGGERLGLLA